MSETHFSTKTIQNAWNHFSTYQGMNRSTHQKIKSKAYNELATSNEWTIVAPQKWLKLRKTFLGVCEPLTSADIPADERLEK